MTLADICGAFRSMLSADWEGHGRVRNKSFRVDQDILEVIDGILFFAKSRKVFVSTQVDVLEAAREDCLCSECLEEVFGVFLIAFKEGLDFQLPR